MKPQSRSIDIRLGNYIPVSPLTFVVVFFGAAFLASTSWYVLAPVWVLLGVAVHLPHYRLHIDAERKFFTEYLFWFGWRKGGPVPFGEIKYIFIRTNKVGRSGYVDVNGQVTNTMANPYQGVVFDAFIVFDGKRKVKLMRRDRKAEILAEVKKQAQTLEVRISDQTGEKPVWVEE